VAGMTHRPLGRCGTKVSVFGLGGWTTFGHGVTDEGDVRRILTAAFDAGVNFFDIADVYANGQAEIMMGKVLRDFPRNELVVSTKVYFPMSDHVNDGGLSRKHIMESVDASLKRIGTDYLDVYFCHRFDDETPMEETARAMDDLIHRGKVLYWGTSEWTGEQLHEVHGLCGRLNLHRPQVEQPQYSLLARSKLERDVRPAAVALGMGMACWSPLCSGILTGKYDEGIPPESRLARLESLRKGRYSEGNVNRVRRMRAIADRLGCTRAQLALAWVARQAGVSSVILGATRVEQLSENLGALNIDVPASAMSELDQLFPVDPDDLSSPTERR